MSKTIDAIGRFSGETAGALSATEVHRRWGRRLLIACFGIVRDWHWAEDAAQEALAAYARLSPEGRDGLRNPENWLVRAGINQAIARLRKESRLRLTEQEYIRRQDDSQVDLFADSADKTRVSTPPYSPADQPLPLSTPTSFDRMDACHPLMAHLSRLPARKRLIVWLRAVEGHSFSEIAVSLKISEQTARNLFSRGIRLLRDRIDS